MKPAPSQNGYDGSLRTIKIDANGNIFVSGRSNSKIVVAKLNSSGVQQFATEVNFSFDYDYIKDLALDSTWQNRSCRINLR